MLDRLWTVLNSEGAAIGILLTILTALWASLRALAMRRRELRAQTFETYHKLIHTLVGKDARGEDPKLDVQIAVIYELRRFPTYFDLSLGILKGLREYWGPDGTRRDNELRSTIDEIDKKSKRWCHRLVRWFRNLSTC